MTGEISLSGVFVPSLLVLAIIAALVTIALIRLANFAGLYRFVGYRALVDLCLFVIVLGLFVYLSLLFGLHQ